MTDPYAWMPPCPCGHGHYRHELVNAAGQRVRGRCDVPLCGCLRYRSPGVPQSSVCPMCGHVMEETARAQT